MNTLTLRPYQLDGIQAIRDAFRHGTRRVLYQLPTGGGKTEIFKHIAQSAASKGKRVAILVHRKELVSQVHERLTMPHGVIQQGVTPWPSRGLQVASVQTLVRRVHKFPPFDLIIVDECFPAGTMIGDRPIETLRAGDLVDSFNEATGGVEKKRVIRTFRNRAGFMLRVHLSNGVTLDCTGNHPIYSNGNWIAARNLRPGDPITTRGHDDDSAMRCMRERLQQSAEGQDVLAGVLHEAAPVESASPADQLPRVQQGCCVDRTGGDSPEGSRASVLQPGMPRGIHDGAQIQDDGRDQSQVRERAHETEKPDVQRPAPRAHETNAQGDWPQAPGAGRERSGAYGASADAVRGIGLGDRDRDQDAGHEMARPQSGHGPSRCEDRGRGGRGITRSIEASAAGPREDSGLGVAWVDRVEILECTSDGRFGGVCPDGYVYNLEVADLHTYFANGVLVHNCHHAVASTYRTILTANPGAFVLGVTATPRRTDGKGLGECFDRLICGPSMQELIDCEFLKPARVYAPAVIDTSAVHTRMGDFVRGELAAVCDTNTVTGDAISHYRRHAHGLPAIAFCVSVAHAVHVSEQFKAAGYRSEFIEGSMGDSQRKRLIGALGTGGLDVLTSCDLISEGVDVPVVSCGIMLRPTQSLTIYLQQVGRCLRPSPRYPEAIILDHAGNCLRHGLHTDDRAWSLDGQPKRPRDGEQLPPMRQCPACYRVHRPAPVCPDCGHVYVAAGREITEREGELVEATARRNEARAEQAKAQTLEELREIARRRGHNVRWADHVFAARQRKQQAEPAMAG